MPPPAPKPDRTKENREVFVLHSHGKYTVESLSEIIFKDISEFLAFIDSNVPIFESVINTMTADYMPTISDGRKSALSGAETKTLCDLYPETLDSVALLERDISALKANELKIVNQILNSLQHMWELDQCPKRGRFPMKEKLIAFAKQMKKNDFWRGLRLADRLSTFKVPSVHSSISKSL